MSGVGISDNSQERSSLTDTSMWKELRENPRALMYAALMHLLLFLALVLNLDWKTTPSGAGQGTVIKAQVVDSSKVQAEIAKLKQAQENKQREEEAHQRKLEQDAQQVEQHRVQEEKRLTELQQKQVEEKQNLQKLEQQRVAQQKLETDRQAKLKQQQVAAEKQAQVKKQQEAKAAQQHAAEQEQKQKAAAEAKQQAAEDKKSQAAAEAKRKAAAERALQQQLAAEESASQLSGQNSDIVDQYKAAIQQAVQNNWLRPPSVRAGLSCTVVVNVIPGGDVAGVRIVESSGDPAFDRSVENAVRKAAPLPLPPDPGLFNNFRELRFVFKPET